MNVGMYNIYKRILKMYNLQTFFFSLLGNNKQFE